jgi:hypothetical protein
VQFPATSTKQDSLLAIVVIFDLWEHFCYYLRSTLTYGISWEGGKNMSNDGPMTKQESARGCLTTILVSVVIIVAIFIVVKATGGADQKPAEIPKVDRMVAPQQANAAKELNGGD